MEEERREVYYDSVLDVEAYRLSGVVQRFPNHFHHCYVLGFLEGGRRRLSCRDQTWELCPGDVVLFNPEDGHCCTPVDGEPLDYRAVNIPARVLEAAAEERGLSVPPRFCRTVVPQGDLAAPLAALWEAVVNRTPELEREEAFCLLADQALGEYAASVSNGNRPEGDRAALVRRYLEEHLTENISLRDLTELTGLSRSRLLEVFTRSAGVSPYRCLQSLRVERARALLESGVSPVDAALRSGFSDQSHFTRFFKEFIGLTPRQYQRVFEEKEI